MAMEMVYYFPSIEDDGEDIDDADSDADDWAGELESAEDEEWDDEYME
jgi:hypothetical protein